MKAYKSWYTVVLTDWSYYHPGLKQAKKTDFGLNRIFAKQRHLSTFTEKQTEKCSSIFNTFSINLLSRRTRKMKNFHHYVHVIQRHSIKPYYVIFYVTLTSVSFGLNMLRGMDNMSAIILLGIISELFEIMTSEKCQTKCADLEQNLNQK